jgi:hypothetical protein
MSNESWKTSEFLVCKPRTFQVEREFASKKSTIFIVFTAKIGEKKFQKLT